MRLVLLIACASLVGCGGGSYARASDTMPQMSSAGGVVSEPAAAGDGMERYAQNDSREDTASDATSIPLLIYTAELGLAVHQVADKLDRVDAIARELGGFLASRTDDMIVIRVPSTGFESAMAQIQALGNVISRRVDVQDVTEEFHDIEIHIQTLEAMRRRVEELLRQANNVEAALAVEQQLERITVELERLRGRLRFLSNRVAFSTITVRFQERADNTEPDFQLPFPWLRYLGLQRLLQL